MLVMSTVLTKTHPYKTVLGYESVVGEDGRPMHKSWGNAIEFNQGAERIGVDVMRWLYSKCLPTAVLLFGYKAADEIRRQFILILWNSYRFFVSLANANRWQPEPNTPKPSHVLDVWILSRLNHTIAEVTKSLDQYYSAPATLSLEKFVSDFSTWYIRRSRDRTTAQAFQTMYQCLLVLSKLLAPFIPYLSDYLYTHLTKKDSVHLASWPEVDKNMLQPQLETDMRQARVVVEKIHSLRKAANLKVRQPLKQATLSSASFGQPDLHQLILAETNLKALKFINTKGSLEVKLDTKLTPALIKEGQARDLVRQIQQARKAAGTDLNELIDLKLPDWPKEFEDYIKQKTLVKNITKAKTFKLVRL